MMCFWSERPNLSGAASADRSAVSEAIAVLMLTVAMPGEAAEGSHGAYCFGGGIFSAEMFVVGEIDVFFGTGSSKVDGFRGGVDTLPRAAAVLVFGSAFAPFGLDVADFLLLIVVVSKTVNLIN